MDTAQRTADRRIVASPRRSSASRRFGYLVAIVVNAVLLYLLNRSPGWESAPFLTQDTPRVLGLVNASIIAGVVANCLYALSDPRWLRAIGDIVTTSIGLAALVRLWNVFPFDFAPAPVDWELVVRWVIGVGIGGSVIAVLVALTQLGRFLTRPQEHVEL